MLKLLTLMLPPTVELMIVSGPAAPLALEANRMACVKLAEAAKIESCISSALVAFGFAQNESQPTRHTAAVPGAAAASEVKKFGPTLMEVFTASNTIPVPLSVNRSWMWMLPTSLGKPA